MGRQHLCSRAGGRHFELRPVSSGFHRLASGGSGSAEGGGMNNVVTTETILDWLKEQVEQKNPVAPSVWLDSAQKLVVLLGDESDKLHRLQQRVAQMRGD